MQSTARLATPGNPDPAGAVFHGFTKQVDSQEIVSVHGADIGLTNLDPSNMYFVILKAIDDDLPDPGPNLKAFDRDTFIGTLFQFQLPNALLVLLLLPFLIKTKFRHELMLAWLVSREMPNCPNKQVRDINRKLGKSLSSEGKHMVASLFTSHLATRGNAEFRRNLFYMSVIIKMFIFLPLLIVISHGIVCIAVVQPTNVGVGILLCGPALLLASYAFGQWYHGGWRMTRLALRLFVTSGLLLLLFMIIVVLADPEDLSLFAITAVMLTINLMPMVWIAFANDSQLKKSFKQITAAVTKNEKLSAARAKFKNLGALGFRLAMGGKKVQEAKQEEAEEAAIGHGGKWLHRKPWLGELDGKKDVGNNSFSALLGDAYSIDANTGAGAFKYSDIVATSFTSSDTARKRVTKFLYMAALGALLLLSILVWTYPGEFFNQGFGTSLTVLALDAAMYMLHRGAVGWSPGKVCAVMAISRVFLAAFVGEFWLVGHSMAYFTVGVVVALEVVSRRLPLMSKSQAGAMAYFGLYGGNKSEGDVGSSPEFVLGYICFVFLLVLLGAIFGAPEGSLPELTVFGQEWPVWVFGVFAYVLILVVGMISSTLKAFYLERRQLLKRQIYLVFKKFTTPFMLASMAEILVVLSGFLLWAITGSTFIAISALFLPILFVLFVRVASQYVRNDWQLLEPREKRRAARWKRRQQLRNGDDEDGEEVQPLLAKGSGKEWEDETKKGDEKSVKPPGVSSANASFALPPLKKTESKAQTNVPDLSSGSKAAKEETKEGGGASKKNEEEAVDVDAIVEEEGGEGSEDHLVKPANKKKKAGAMTRFKAWMKAESDPQKMSDFAAFMRGSLTETDYVTIWALLAFAALTFVYGIIVHSVEDNMYLGHTIWVSIFVIVLSIPMLVKYFFTYRFTKDMLISLILAGALLTAGVFGVFAVVLDADITNGWSVLLFCLWLLYPAFLAGATGFTLWADGGWRVTRAVIVLGVIGGVSFLVFIVLMFAWGGVFVGSSFLIIGVLLGVALFYIHAWVNNEFYLPPIYSYVLDIAMTVASVLAIAIGVLFDVSLFYCFSVGFVCIIARHLGRAWSRKASMPPYVPVFYSPFIFPLYSYDPHKKTIVSENQFGKDYSVALGSALLWGIFATMFVEDIEAGVAIMCLVISLAVVLVAYVIAATPIRLGAAARFADENVLKSAGSQAREDFFSRRKAFHILCDEFAARDKREAELEAEIQKYQLGGRGKAKGGIDRAVKRTSAAEIATRLAELKWRMNHVFPWTLSQEDRDFYKVHVPSEQMEELQTTAKPMTADDPNVLAEADEDDSGEEKEPWEEMAPKPEPKPHKKRTCNCGRLRAVTIRLIPCGRACGLRDKLNYDPDAPIRRRDAYYTWGDAWRDLYKHGRGPLSFLTCGAFFYRLYHRKQMEKTEDTQNRYDHFDEDESSDSESESDSEEEGEEKSEADGEEKEESGSEASGSDGEEEKKTQKKDKKKKKRDKLALPPPKAPAADIQVADQDGEGPQAQDTKAMLQDIVFLEKALAREYFEEIRCVAEFQILVLVAAESRLRTEAVLFQKFLREYRYAGCALHQVCVPVLTARLFLLRRFKLMASGVQPPEYIFKTQSYATVDVQQVATWLSRLTDEQRERFKQLKERFTTEVDSQYKLRLLADAETEEVRRPPLPWRSWLIIFF